MFHQTEDYELMFVSKGNKKRIRERIRNSGTLLPDALNFFS